MIQMMKVFVIILYYIIKRARILINQCLRIKGWEKEKTVSVSVPQPTTATNSNQATRKRIAESSPPTAPPSKVNN